MDRLANEEVWDLADHPARRLGCSFSLEECPDSVADLLLGALDRSGVMVSLGSQLIPHLLTVVC
jgi:hypothetical protein